MLDQFVTQAAWWSENALEALLLYRAVQGRFFVKYPVFYSYLTYVLLSSLSGFAIYMLKPAFYPTFYWSLQLVSVTIGYCVIWEIFRQVFHPYPGAARLAGKALAAILVFVLCKVFLNASLHGRWVAPARNPADLEKYLRIVQAALLLTIVWLVTYYVIPLGRNIKGMILGYGLFIGLSVIQLALGAFLGNSFQKVWSHLASVSYSAALVAWCATLWTYQPSESLQGETSFGHDYERLSARTATMLTQLRGNLLRTPRP